ncbi:NAD(P)-dependent oxidoreductase [Streptomyces sp. NPDC048639]|uniref:NAD(P)-dependent oxidoreductase n=1 Tax=Streptomyces sp. NPDC048639 TaxID=3365581 RepID=UPI00371A045B
MRITVFGATGGIGREIVRQALTAGHEVTAVVRDPARLSVPESGTVEVVTAGLTDPALLGPAVAGRDAVFSGLGPRSRKQVGIASSGTRTILRAMEAEGVRRFLAVSAAPVGPPPEGESLRLRLMTPLVKAVFRDQYADLAVMEEDVRRSGTDWTVVRPPRLHDRPLTGSYRKAFATTPKDSMMIGRADVAHAMLAMADDASTVQQAVGVAY